MGTESLFPTVGDGSGLDATGRLYLEEVQLALRNKALLTPRPVSQPGLTGSVGTAEWTGRPSRPCWKKQVSGRM
jgi:hypothetical protein